MKIVTYNLNGIRARLPEAALPGTGELGDHLVGARRRRRRP